MVLKNNEQTQLRPVLALHGYVCNLPEETGRYTCKFTVQEGTIQITHRSYDTVAGMWCLPPVSGTPESYILSAGEEAEITFEDNLHDWEPDIIYIANHSYLKHAAFTCSYQKEASEGAGSGLLPPGHTGKKGQSRIDSRVMRNGILGVNQDGGAGFLYEHVIEHAHIVSPARRGRSGSLVRIERRELSAIPASVSGKPPH